MIGMPIAAHLLGPPLMVRDGVVYAPPKGKKVWAADALNEDAHVLLIRAFAGTGDRIAAERQLAASIDLFRRELDIEPGPELAEAAVIEPGRASPSVGAGRPALQALIESGEAAVNAGAIEAGLANLRDAVAGSREASETQREAAAQLALGSALVHASRGKGEEGARRSGMHELSVRAYLHRRDVGDRSAMDAVRVLSVGVENPHLDELIDQEGPALLDDLLGKVGPP
jgi:hypothetical protein